MKKGKFIVLEGIDGAGKTTIKNKIVEILKKEKKVKKIFSTREPGSTPIAEKLRFLLKNQKDDIITIQAEILMLYAARVQLLETVIKPALKKGIWIIGDRHDLSSQTYQVCKCKKVKNLIHLLKKNLLGQFEPDITFYLDIEPKIGIERIKKRGSIDFFEKKSIKFFECIRKRYLKIAISNPRIYIINTKKNFNSVISLIRKILINSSYLK